MKTLAKTKILRCRGGELYFRQVRFGNGDIRWQKMCKDTSALIRSDRDTKFKGQDAVCRTPIPADYENVRNVPANFATDLLTPYAALEYAAGHAPVAPIRF